MSMELELMKVSEEGDLKTLKLLILQNVDVNYKNQWGVTALMKASTYGNLYCIKCLIKAGALVNIKDKEKWTALMYCARYGNVDCFQYLLKKGADFEYKNINDCTILDMLQKEYNYTKNKNYKDLINLLMYELIFKYTGLVGFLVKIVVHYIL
jgi:ankyrin repeat protein